MRKKYIITIVAPLFLLLFLVQCNISGAKIHNSKDEELKLIQHFEIADDQNTATSINSKEVDGYSFRDEIYFSYLSTCNIAFQVKDTLLNIIFDECCGNPIDSLRLVRTDQYSGYDIVDTHGAFYYSISIHDREGNQIDMINNGSDGPDFVRYDDNAQQIEPYNGIQTCEHVSKGIVFWTSLDSIRMDEFQSVLKDRIPIYYKDGSVDSYIKKAQYLARLGRFNEAIIVYKALLDKNWGKKIFLYKELADCYWQEGEKRKSKKLYLKYLKLESDDLDTSYIKDRIKDL